MYTDSDKRHEPLCNMLYLLARKRQRGLAFDDEALLNALKHWQISNLQQLLRLSDSDLDAVTDSVVQLLSGNGLSKAS